MKVTYINHSGFSIELPTATLLFDYYKGQIPSFPQDKPLFVFASHFHSDHFNPEIFKLSQIYPEVTYILSHDIWTSRKKYIRDGALESWFTDSIILRAHQEITLAPSLIVKTLRSTDMGVAFLIQCDGKTIYHAGGLHWWRWNGDTKQEIRNMEANFKREIDTLSNVPIDVAFVPLDPRLEEHYHLGMNYLLDTAIIQHIFPMHFWDDPSVISRYLEEYPMHDPTHIYEIHSDGQVWHINS